ncbi:ATP synthase F0 subunit C [Candidatus Margulisiibacteriota bacterium]
MEFVRISAILGAGLAMGLGAIGSAVGEGLIASKAIEALGRQPRAKNKLLRLMLIGQAVAETASIFALVVALILVFQKAGNFGFEKGFCFIAAGLAMGLGTIGSGAGAGLPGSAACEGVGRQPGNADILIFHMLIGQAVSQTACIFALTISLILIISNPGQGIYAIFSTLGAGIAMGFGAIGPGMGSGTVARFANLAVGRNPRELTILTRTMLIGQAVTETTSIYSAVIALILIFVV